MSAYVRWLVNYPVFVQEVSGSSTTQTLADDLALLVAPYNWGQLVIIGGGWSGSTNRSLQAAVSSSVDKSLWSTPTANEQVSISASSPIVSPVFADINATKAAALASFTNMPLSRYLRLAFTGLGFTTGDKLTATINVNVLLKNI